MTPVTMLTDSIYCCNVRMALERKDSTTSGYGSRRLRVDSNARLCENCGRRVEVIVEKPW